MSVFHDWTPNEIAAMHRATAKLRAKQPKEKEKPLPTGVRGCYYNASSGVYLVNTYIKGQRVYCGTLKQWDRDKAYRMQYEVERKYSTTPQGHTPT